MCVCVCVCVSLKSLIAAPFSQALRCMSAALARDLAAILVAGTGALLSFRRPVEVTCGPNHYHLPSCECECAPAPAPAAADWSLGGKVFEWGLVAALTAAGLEGFRLRRSRAAPQPEPDAAAAPPAVADGARVEPVPAGASLALPGHSGPLTPSIRRRLAAGGSA